MSPIVEIENLTRRFAAFTAVDTLTLTANADEVFGLLGSNGAGKSTTIKMLTTLLPPTSGEARVGGFSITTQPVEVRRVIGYVPQAVSVDGSLTGYENLLIFAKLYDIPHKEQEARSPLSMSSTLIHTSTGFVFKTFVIAEFELRKLRHDFTELITRALQPVLWLLIFGQVFAQSGMMHTGNVPYLDFIAPGILAQSVLFVAIFYGINVIWERDLGIVQKFLVSSTPRSALVLGKGFSAGIRTLSQLVVVYGLSMLLGVKLNWSPLALVNVLAIVIPAATLFSTFSLIIACIVKTRERFMGVGQVLTMPLFFASNAIYPTTIMPAWLKVISHLNPLTYVVDALRTSMLAGGASTFGLGMDYAVILLTTIVLVIIGARLHPQLGV